MSPPPLRHGLGALVAKCFLLVAILAALSAARPEPQSRNVVRNDPRAKRNSLARFKNLIDMGTDETRTDSAAPAATTAPLECFQVAEPVLTHEGLKFRDAALQQIAAPTPAGSSTGADASTVLLFEHSFTNSYGYPFVGNYTPPDHDFDRVVLNFTVLVRGRQYDRTGVLYLGDTEVWRTTTAEPTSYGIRWVWLKDVTPFLSLWKRPQTLIFDLENIVDNTYTGILNTTLTATFFKGPVGAGGSGRAPADLIIPISEGTGSTGEPSQFTYPEQEATSTVSFPRNANRAVFTVDVKGQGDEEFWWSNVPQSATDTFKADYGAMPGYSPFREVQVLIDDQLAGVSWPFPVIFTGGVVPQLHRPIVGIEAFDIRESEIDITPWLPLLCNGEDHTFNIRVVGLEDDGVSQASLSSTTHSSWYITGKVFVWLDDEGSVTTGTSIKKFVNDPSINFSQRIKQSESGSNETLDYTLAVTRTLSFSSYVKTQRGQGAAKWTQSLSYKNNGSVYARGYDNVNTLNIAGADAATSAGLDISYSARYSYPLFCNSSASYLPQGNLTLRAQLDQGIELEIWGASVFPSGLEGFAAVAGPEVPKFQGSVRKTLRNGTAIYQRPGDNTYSTGVGQSHQIFSFRGLSDRGEGEEVVATPLYYRNVSASNDTVVKDHVELWGESIGNGSEN
ncbi:peptide N-acetyl-beta-D-glucosaminyl asparaginase amidase A-domain-containing protein [Durotheca rogersii]|uniref:peptide N-acetyl-beta-D-glucosaminyl asparaginase amidase A-domain-containing protein n=1 Tax=Durotheca rogersii TaxID=419775 RepID=UPI00221F7DFD|nr:peptide N-acetyl-beta-D-glucosaminyl asparaginase amidase A-domain-containing protein [Durotheca rogersii]KAI5862428.1 peptide N-acetyl-beta-D-glucosaminyl asparaginase amidase A-domain-containing protein [Durotheca rogersii]